MEAKEALEALRTLYAAVRNLNGTAEEHDTLKNAAMKLDVFITSQIKKTEETKEPSKEA